MDNRKLVTIFWSGGWDGTFRMLELAQMDVIVQPVYINDPGRGSVEYEHNAMGGILEKLRESATAEILDIIFYDVSQIRTLCADREISEAYKELAVKYGLGSQYEWMALLANKLGIRPETGVEDEPGCHARAVLRGEGRLNCSERETKSDTQPAEPGQYCFIPNEPGSAADKVMNMFRYPIAVRSKHDMERIACENGWMDIMRMSWFCHSPIDGQPCGLCHPCNDIMNYKMDWRMPDVSLERWKHREELLRMAAPGIPSVVRRIAEHSNLYKKVTGKDLNLLHPHDLNEKLQWLMVFRYDKNVSCFADKLAVRKYVEQCGFTDILTKIYGVWKSGAEVDRNALPDKYALKCNHGSGDMFYALCRGKDAKGSGFDRDAAIDKLDRALSYDYARVGYEYHYSYIEPCIYAEELLENEDGSPLVDYKFFCFGGEPRYVKVIADRESGKHQDYYDMDWHFCPMVRDEITMGGKMPMPTNFKRMKEIAAKLSEPFPMARVDLYDVDGRVYFGEITLTPATGLNRTDKPETLEILGELVNLNGPANTGETGSSSSQAGTENSGSSDNMAGMENSGSSDNMAGMEKSGNCESTTDKGRSNIAEQEQILTDMGGRILSSGLIPGMPRDNLNAIMQDCVRILNSDGSNRLKEIYMNILYRAAFRDDMSLEECWQIFRDIDRAMFVNYALKLWADEADSREADIAVCVKRAGNSPQDTGIDVVSSGMLRKLYGLIFDFVQSQTDYSGKKLRGDGLESDGLSDTQNDCQNAVSGRKIAVVLTSQLLKIGHAPTRRVLDYSYALQHDLGYRVIIVNDGGMHYYHSESLGDDIEFTFLEEYTDKDSIEHRGEKFELLQVGSLMPDLGVMQQLVDMIYELRPAFVYNIGASSLVADLCDPFVPVYALPCNSNLPVSMCSNLLLCREKETLGSVEGLRPYQRIIETEYNFTFAEATQEYRVEEYLPEELRISRAGGLSPDEGLFTVATVGYRIGDELDEDFVTMIGRALVDVPNMVMFVIGEIRENAPIRDIIERVIPVSVRERLILTGGMQGASAFFKNVRLVLNPDRSGGGRSIFEANHYGIPTVSLRKGDGYYSGGIASGADDYGEYLRLIVRYATDRDFYARRSAEAARRAKSLEDIAGTIRKVVEAE